MSGPRSEQLRLRLRDAVVALCREQAFYLKQLRIEGTLCVVSDQSSVLITQISEQIGDMVKQESSEHEHLPQLDPEQRGGAKDSQPPQFHHAGDKRYHDQDETVATEHVAKRIYQADDANIDSQDDGQRYTVHVHTSNEQIQNTPQNDKNSSLEQATLSYQSFNESESSNISQLEEAIQDFPEITKINGKFQCPLCEKSYAFKHSAKAHLSTHNKNMKYACKLCPAKFSYASSLNGHTKKHHPDSMSKEYVCELCQQICFNLPSLKQHYTWRHKDMKVPGVLYEPPSISADEGSSSQGEPESRRTTSVFPGQSESGDGGRVPQQQAVAAAGSGGGGGGGQGDDTLDILQQVIQRYSSDGQHIVPPPPIQSYNYNQLQQHNVHMASHNVPMVTEASLVSVTVNRLQQEQYSPPQGRNIAAAGVGGMNSSSSGSNNPSPLLLPSPSVLPPGSPKEKLHIADHFDEVNIQTQHGVYKYQCKTCANMFKSRHALYEHVNTHLGRKPFSCDTCGLTFAHHSTLYNHKRNKHTFSSKAEKEALFKFKCPQCDKRFEFPSALDRHFAKYPEHSIKREFSSPNQDVLHTSASTSSSNQDLQQGGMYNDRLPPIQSVAHSIAMSLSSVSSHQTLAGVVGQNTYIPLHGLVASSSNPSLAPPPPNSSMETVAQSPAVVTVDTGGSSIYSTHYHDQGTVEQSTGEVNNS